jgi:hypothetical protein
MTCPICSLFESPFRVYFTVGAQTGHRANWYPHMQLDLVLLLAWHQISIQRYCVHLYNDTYYIAIVVELSELKEVGVVCCYRDRSDASFL